MKYMGSKRRIAKHIIPIMVDAADKEGITDWIEPFVGGGNLIDKVPDRFNRMGYDLNPHVIQAMIDIRDYPELLPDSVSEEEYKSYKGREPEEITSWVRFVCAFGSMFEGGYAKDCDKKSTWHAKQAKKNALKQSQLIKSVSFEYSSYDKLKPIGALIYCDPPYKGTTGYKTGSFDHDKFYDWCRNMAKDNVVFVSEYSAPDDFVEVWRNENEFFNSCSVKGGRSKSVEKLFRVML